MKGIVELGSCWQLKTVSHFSNSLQYLIRAEKSGRKFTIFKVLEGDLFESLELYEHLVPNIKVSFCSALIGIVFHPLLCLLQVTFKQALDFNSLLKEIIHTTVTGFASLVEIEAWGRMTVQSLKGGHGDGGMMAGIIPPFRKRKPARPVLWPLVNETPEEHFDTLIKAFTLAICLRMVSRGKLRITAHLFE